MGLERYHDLVVYETGVCMKEKMKEEILNAFEIAVIPSNMKGLCELNVCGSYENGICHAFYCNIAYRIKEPFNMTTNLMKVKCLESVGINIDTLDWVCPQCGYQEKNGWNICGNCHEIKLWDDVVLPLFKQNWKEKCEII